MLKKLVMLALAVICFLPTVSLANDPGQPIPDKNNLVSVDVKLSSKEALVNGTLDFTVTLSNNTSDTLSDVFIRSIFVNEYIEYLSDHEIYSDLLTPVGPYETFEWNISVTVPLSICWYEKNDSFYTDFQFRLDYQFEDDGYYKYYYETGVTPIKLTNLEDGSQLVDYDLKLTDYTDEVLYFGKMADSYHEVDEDGVYHEIIDEYMSCYTNSKIYVSNSSGKQIDEMVLRINENDYYINYDTTKLSNIHGDSNLEYDNFYVYNYNESSIPSEHEIILDSIYQIKDHYYAVTYNKKFRTTYMQIPILDMQIVYDNDNPDNCELLFKNVSGVDYNELYIIPNEDFKEHDPDLSSNHFYNIDKNKTLSFTIDATQQGSRFIVGYIEDNKLFYWRLECGFNAEYKEQLKLYRITFEIINLKPTPTPTPKPTPTPNPRPTASPTPKPTSTPKSTPAVTVSPTPKPSPTASPTAAIAINSITKKPAVPSWVWIALACALLATGAVSVLLHIRRSNTNDK